MQREPRPLSASASLLRALHACAGTSIKSLRGARKPKPSLSLVALERLEQEIGARLHDDILVLLALRDPVAALVTGILDVNSVADAADENAAPEGWVCIAVVYSDPVGELVGGEHGGAYLHLAAERDPRGEEARILVGSDGLEGVDDEGEPLGSFIEHVLFEARSGEWRDDVFVGPADGAVSLDPTPMLVRGRQLQPKATGGGSVSHPKFGVGTVLERSGEGEAEKVVVQFADKQRTLLARFLQPRDLPDEG